jgi:cytochrome P450
MPSPFVVRAQVAAARLSFRLPSRTEMLAAPPAGSGLRPILGDGGLPVIGHTIGLLGDGLTFGRRQVERYGQVSWFGGLGRRVVSVTGPDGIGEVLTNRNGDFSNQQGWEFVIGPFFHRGVMLMDFDEHRQHRRIMQHAFKNERLVEYLAGLNPNIERGISEWVPSERFRLYDATKQLTLDLATTVFVGDTLGPEADQLNRSFQHAVVGGGTALRADVPGGRWHRGLRGRAFLEEYFRSRLPAKRASDGRDLFSVLCHAESEDGERFSDEDIVNHMIFVLMAAHDTSTATLAWMAYFLASHPEWQDRVREESLALGKDAIDYEDLDRLTAMDLAMKETLRMYAPVGVLFRETLRDTSILDHYLPAGTLVGLGLYSSMRMEPWWSEPDRWDPGRFSEERREDLSHKYAWVPFGGNVHKCIGLHFGGMEVKAILHQLLLRYSLSVPSGYLPPLTHATGPIPADGLPLQLRRLRRSTPAASGRQPEPVFTKS